jgi:Tfp pilus assembly protein PilO
MNVSVSAVAANAGNPVATTNASSSLIKPIGSISFAMTAIGSYEDFKNFLSEIETNARIFDVKNLSVQPAPQGGSAIKDLFTYNVTIVAYYQTP